MVQSPAIIMIRDVRPLGTLLLTLLLGCASPPHPIAPTVMLENPPEPPFIPSVAPPEVVACVETARAAAMVATRPDITPPVADGCARILFENTMSPTFVVKRVVFTLDGKVIVDQREPVEGRGPVASAAIARIFLGRLSPGHHLLTELVDIFGAANGHDDLRGYRFELRSSHLLTIATGHALDLHAVLFERLNRKTGERSPPEERPAARYSEGEFAPAADAPPAGTP